MTINKSILIINNKNFLHFLLHEMESINLVPNLLFSSFEFAWVDKEFNFSPCSFKLCEVISTLFFILYKFFIDPVSKDSFKLVIKPNSS